MPSTEARLAWGQFFTRIKPVVEHDTNKFISTALQVDVETLGANLEAYVKLLPTLAALRLSNRYGQGPHATVAKLPPEIISIIEDFLMSAERDQISQKWRKDFRCYRLLCDPSDHYTAEEYQDYLKAAREDKSMGANAYTDDHSPETRVEIYLDDKFEDWCDTHHERSFRWHDRVGMSSAWRRGIFSQHKGVIEKHFGLSVWISHVRLDDYIKLNFWEVSELEPPVTTVAYLTLPGGNYKYRASILTKNDCDEKEFFLERGYGMPVHVPPPLSEHARKRFKRMMQILSLKPSMEESQSDLDLYADQNPSKDEAEPDDTPPSETGTEPQLTMLIRQIVRSDEYE